MMTIEEAKQFIKDADKSRENWHKLAVASWMEIKKQQRNNIPLQAIQPNTVKRLSKYPAWYSIFKIRQPLVLSRIGIPVGRDTTQDGNDNIGATAAICLERLATNLPKSFDFFDVLSSARDDGIVTNVGTVRGYYEKRDVKQKVKEYITPQKSEETGEVIFLDGSGAEVLTDNISQDDEGYFIEHDEVVDVVEEKICLEPVLYSDLYVDPGIRRWARCRRIAFACHYSQREFVDIFGKQALESIPAPKEDENDPNGSAKRQCIKVFEFWDEYEKKVYWFADGGSDFIKPKGYKDEDEEYQEEEVNGLYNLEKFFPCPEPFVLNQCTDEFWPVPEYFQVQELLEDIHRIFARMMAVTRAIRSRLLFDSNVEGLQAALNEATEGDAIGVTNLAQSLAGAGGTLEGVVQYIPVEKMINGLQQLYVALEQRLNTLYKLTGTSDLLQGLVTDPTQRTFGERQMTEKYALNQLAEPQRKMQEFVRSCYQLMCEMALKNFKDASLEMYIMPQTLQPDQQQQYKAAVEMLRQNTKRFRIELETDSTIALNEQYDKQMRVELVNTLTSAIEKTASTAASSPALVGIELHALKFLVQGFKQGKLFQQEITQAIDDVIKMSEETPAPFNKEQADFELEKQKFQLRVQEVQQKAGIEQQKVQAEMFRTSADIQKGNAELSLQQRRDELMGQLAVLNYQLDQQKAGVEIQNKLADNERLTMELAYDAQRESRPDSPQVVVVPSAPAAPVIVAPQAAPVSGPTIINAPNPAPQTSVIQPVQQIPVPMIPGL